MRDHLTPDERAVLIEIFKLANEKGKFAFQVGASMRKDEHDPVFEDMLLRGEVRLIDVTMILASETIAPFIRLCRIFALSPALLAEREFYRENGWLE